MMGLLGWGEIVVIVVLGLIIIDPKDLPKILYHLGRLWRQLSALGHTLAHDFEEHSFEEKGFGTQAYGAQDTEDQGADERGADERGNL